MATAIDRTDDDKATVCWGRGDSDAKVFEMKTAAGAAENIAGRTYRMTVNSERNPVNASNQQFTMVGVVTDGPAGLVEFAPTTIDTDIPGGTYYYDIEETNGGVIRTRIKGVCVILQDVSK